MLRVARADPRVLSLILSDSVPPVQVAAELARSVNLSSSWFQHLFKSQTGKTLREWLLEKRLETAAQPLEQTGMQVKEVAYRVGYRHPASFVRAFTKLRGMSPRAYRQHQQLKLLTKSAWS